MTNVRYFCVWQYGTTALIWACRKGNLEIVETLLGEGAAVDASGMVSTYHDF